MTEGRRQKAEGRLIAYCLPSNCSTAFCLLPSVPGAECCRDYISLLSCRAVMAQLSRRFSRLRLNSVYRRLSSLRTFERLILAGSRRLDSLRYIETSF